MSKDNKVFILIFTLVALAALMLYLSSCNPVKRVLKDPFKTQQVFDEGVKLGWCVNDSVYISDTTIILDTLNVIETVSDTVQIGDSVWIDRVEYRTITKTVTIRDTTVITDNSRINLLQKQLIKQDGEIIQLDNKVKEAKAETKKSRQERNKWRLWFFLLLGAFGVWIFRKPILKLISPIKL